MENRERPRSRRIPEVELVEERGKGNSTQLWIIAGALGVVAMLMLGCTGFFALSYLRNEQEKEELLRREPWRQYYREPYKYDRTK